MIADTNTIIRSFLANQATLTDLVGGASPRIYCPRLPENATLPAVSFFTRGGTANPHIEKIVSPSVQFQCWADNPIDAREVYRALFTILQGLQMQTVTIDAIDYAILSAIEEVQGQDLQDVDIPNYFSVLTFFEIQVRVGT